MPRKPARRHVIAEVRIRAGLSQAELAKILGCAAVTVQRIEQGKLGLSEDLAVRAQKELGVSAAWLLANDPAQLVISPIGGLWAKDIYEATQGARLKNKQQIRHALQEADKARAENEFISLKAAEAGTLIHAMLEGTKGLPKQGILLHRLNKMLESLKEDFPPDKRKLEELRRLEIEKARDEHDLTVYRLTEGENERLWGNIPDEPEK
jgi:transcriptional regulator with XRE-family HTH domain